MTNATELEHRGQALEAALRTAPEGEDGSRIIDRAREYYLYLSGQSPAHPAPRVDPA